MDVVLSQSAILIISCLVGFFVFLISIIVFKSKVKIESLNKSHEKIITELKESFASIESELDEQITKAEQEIKLQKTKADTLEVRYKDVIDAEQVAIDIKRIAESDAAELISDAEEYKDFTQGYIDKLKIKNESVLSQTKELRAEARKILEQSQISATERAEKIIANAKTEAKAIAAEAYDIKGKEKEISNAIVAMQNTIEGYKDDYIVPNITVLDELADEYSFSEPGTKLKELRAEMRRLVKNNLAGTCEYVEPNRKAYAIHFVVDAFNGKVDSILAKVRHDNYGKLAQGIKDAFALVNFNGAPFKNARITDTFLQVRLEELRWAVATYELKQIEIQEQREHKEKIREENKARKEYEAALKKAEREEKLIEDAIRSATEKLEKASAEERALFESNIIDLKQKLKEAEERSQRALSMAQQTKRGHVYVISNIGSFGEKVFKIGMTRRLDPNDRIKELGDASVPFSFDIHAMIYSEDAPALEAHLHRVFDDRRVNKVNTRKEFFNTSITEIKNAVAQIDIKEEIHWTLKAQAEEYFESIQLENLHIVS